MKVLPSTKDKGELTGWIQCACYHCGERFGASGSKCARFCKFCKTAEQRKTMDTENLEIDPKFICEFCTAMTNRRNS